jgi:hypothetical protein
MKKKLLFMVVGILSFLVNFTIYNISFNAQATPYMQEEQRVDSSILMLKTTLPAFFFWSIVVTVVFYLISRIGNGKQR